MPADTDASDQARHNSTSERSAHSVKLAKRPGDDDEKLDAKLHATLRSAYSVQDALRGPLRNYNFANFANKEKGTLRMGVGKFCFHFAGNKCVPVEKASKLTFVHDTLAYIPEGETLEVAKVAVGFKFDVHSFKVGDNAQFMADLPTLLLITCTTPIVGVRLNLWSYSVGTLATRGFDVEPCLQPTPDPYTHGPHCSGDPNFVENQFGNVMKFKLLSSSCLSLTLRDGEWKLSLNQPLGCSKSF